MAYWKIPAEEDTAINGGWIEGPGDDFFGALQQEFKDLPVIAEDLGIITQDVTDAMERFGFSSSLEKSLANSRTIAEPDPLSSAPG